MNNKNSVLLIEALNLQKIYNAPGGELQVLKNVSFSMKPGELVFIFGRSGSGKSTLLHLLGGMDVVTHGKILFDGKEVSKLSEKDRARFRNTKVGFVFQAYHLLPELNLFENVILPARIQGKEDPAWARVLLERVGVWDRRSHYPSELSGGEQQRASIARAFINRPSVVLCDEPTGNLDDETAKSVFDLMLELHREVGQALIIVTHDEGLAKAGGRTLRLKDGTLV